MPDPLAGLPAPRATTSDGDADLQIFVCRATATDPACLGVKYIGSDGRQYGRVWDKPEWLDAMGITIGQGNRPTDA